MMTCLRASIVLTIGAFNAPQAQSQTTGGIAGTVKDQTGAVVVDAKVTVVSDASGDARKITTDDGGSYAATLLPRGLYRVSITAPRLSGSIVRGCRGSHYGNHRHQSRNWRWEGERILILFDGVADITRNLGGPHDSEGASPVGGQK
jgi:hypothetical protein